MRAVILVHAELEGPGRLGPLLDERGFTRTEIQLWRGEPLPAPDDGELWVVMGGPMGVPDLGDPRYPFLAPEAAALRARIAAGRPTLGICLGAQLIAHAAGARVYSNVRRVPDGSQRHVLEVGWKPIDLVADDPAFAGIPPSPTTLHWHGDTFDLPIGATLLASTAACPHQAFRLGRAIYALQFHPEVDLATAREWARADAEYVNRANGPQGVDELLRDNGRAAATGVACGERMLANILDEMGFAARNRAG